jgi:hypothetical protein
VRWFNYGVGEVDETLVAHPDEVWYRLSLDANEPWKRIALQRGSRYAGLISDEACTLYANPLSRPRSVYGGFQTFDEFPLLSPHDSPWASLDRLHTDVLRSDIPDGFLVVYWFKLPPYEDPVNPPRKSNTISSNHSKCSIPRQLSSERGPGLVRV